MPAKAALSIALLFLASSLRCGDPTSQLLQFRVWDYDQALAAIAVTSTRIPSTANDATPTAARTGHGLAKKRL